MTLFATQRAVFGVRKHLESHRRKRKRFSETKILGFRLHFRLFDLENQENSKLEQCVCGVQAFVRQYKV
jgi:hypothetical protein